MRACLAASDGVLPSHTSHVGGSDPVALQMCFAACWAVYVALPSPLRRDSEGVELATPGCHTGHQMLYIPGSSPLTGAVPPPPLRRDSEGIELASPGCHTGHQMLHIPGSSPLTGAVPPPPPPYFISAPFEVMCLFEWLQSRPKVPPTPSAELTLIRSPQPAPPLGPFDVRPDRTHPHLLLRTTGAQPSPITSECVGAGGRLRPMRPFTSPSLPRTSPCSTAQARPHLRPLSQESARAPTNRRSARAN